MVRAMLTPRRKHALGPEEPATPRKGPALTDGTPSSPTRSQAARARRYEEARTQRGIVAELRRLGVLVMRLENAAERTPAQIARDKAMGLLPGAPDLVVPLYRLAIEVKSATGTVSDAQAEVHRALRACGWTVVIARGLSDVLPHIR